MSDSAVPSGEDRADESDGDADHLEDVPDGAGCVEIWEKIGDRRDD